MIFEENQLFEKIGIKLGYLIGYFLFTTILFLVLTLYKKPVNYFEVILITLSITLIGTLIKRLLKWED